MRDFAAFCTLMACLIVLVASIIAMVRPLPKVGLGTRKRALGGLGVAVALFIVTAIVIPAPDVKSEADMPATSAQPATAPPVGANVELTPEQDKSVSFARALIIPLVACSSSVDSAQSMVDKAAAERARPIDAYVDAKSAAKFCQEATVTISSIENDVPDQGQKIAAQAIKYCGDSVSVRHDAMKRLMAILDGTPGLEEASQYKEKKNEAAGHDYACRMTLEGMGEAMKIPASELDFVKP